MSYAETRTARKLRPCGSDGCQRKIQPGDDYVRWVAFPDYEVNTGDRPWVMNVCERCQTEYGKPMPPRRTKRTGEAGSDG